MRHTGRDPPPEIVHELPVRRPLFIEPDADQTAGPEKRQYRLKDCPGIRRVMHHADGIDAVEILPAKRQLHQVGLNDVHVGQIPAELGRFLHRVADVDRKNLRPAPPGLKGITSAAAPGIEHPQAGKRIQIKAGLRMKEMPILLRRLHIVGVPLPAEAVLRAFPFFLKLIIHRIRQHPRNPFHDRILRPASAGEQPLLHGLAIVFGNLQIKGSSLTVIFLEACRTKKFIYKAGFHGPA